MLYLIFNYTSFKKGDYENQYNRSAFASPKTEISIALVNPHCKDHQLINSPF